MFGKEKTNIINGWKIVGRQYSSKEQQQYNLIEMLASIDSQQPKQVKFIKDEMTEIEKIKYFKELCKEQKDD